MHHNPRTVANNPAGEITLNLGITGPAYTIGAACAAGNMGIIQGLQCLQLGQVDLALAGGISESPHNFGIYAAFKNQGALGHNQDPEKSSLPLGQRKKWYRYLRGGAIFVLERLEDAQRRNANIYGEIIGYHVNSDASDFVLPNQKQQIKCIRRALKKSGIMALDVDLVNMHATGTTAGDLEECKAVGEVFKESQNTYFNCTKGLIGHTMGAAGALELAGNLPGFQDEWIHSIGHSLPIDPECNLPGLVKKKIKHKTNIILNNFIWHVGYQYGIDNTKIPNRRIKCKQ